LTPASFVINTETRPETNETETQKTGLVAGIKNKTDSRDS